MSACSVISVGMLFPGDDDSLTKHLLPSAPQGRSAQLLRMDRLCGLALCAADRALFKGGAVNRIDPAHTAVIVGSAYGCHRSDEEFFRSLLDGQPGPRLFAYTLPSSPVGEVSIQHNLLGPGLSIVTGRTAGLEALGQAEELLRCGRVTACLIIACEVGAPAVPERFEDAELRDGAVAVLLGSAAAGQGQLLRATTAFVSGDPTAALAACVAELRAHDASARPALLCDAQTAELCGAALDPLHIHETSSCGAASALATFAALPSLNSIDAPTVIVLSADPCGQAAAVLWRRIFPD